MRTVLLGPQRFMTTAGTALRSLGVEGPVATINAGWEEREDAVDELDTVLGGDTRHLRLYHRSLDVITKDEAFGSAALAFRDRHDALLSLYRLRLQNAMDGVYAVQRRTREGEGRARGEATAYAALDDSIEVVRHVDRWYAGQLKGLYARPRRGGADRLQRRDRLAPRRARRPARAVGRGRPDRWPRRHPAADVAALRDPASRTTCR